MQLVTDILVRLRLVWARKLFFLQWNWTAPIFQVDIDNSESYVAGFSGDGPEHDDTDGHEDATEHGPHVSENQHDADSEMIQDHSGQGTQAMVSDNKDSDSTGSKMWRI